MPRLPVGLAVMRRFNLHFGDTANALFLALLFPALR